MVYNGSKCRTYNMHVSHSSTEYFSNENKIAYMIIYKHTHTHIYTYSDLYTDLYIHTHIFIIFVFISKNTKLGVRYWPKIQVEPKVSFIIIVIIGALQGKAPFLVT